ncbi:MAG: LysR family transcriptional regulator [Proteobacteria bacterium]|nr:LysR family transcriptional regulator [Pseudomonadota bacterium]
MRLGHFDLNLLVALDALLETKSVTKAADRLCIGASATSSALGRLREHYNDELLHQIGRRMELTPLAKTLVQPVRDIILRTQRTVGARPGFDPASEGRHFVFNVSDYAGSVFIPPLLRHLQLHAPAITLDLLGLGDNALERLERGEVDFVIVPDRYGNEKLPSVPLFDEGYSCVVWRGNKLVGDALSLEQYLSMGHVAARFGDSRVVAFEGWYLQQCGINRRVEVVASTFNALPQLVVGTTRVATVHTRMAQLYARRMPLKVLPLPVDIPRLQMLLQWHGIRDDDPAHAWMREQMQHVARVHCP